MPPRLLIIGATGFVGSNWARRAAEKFEVWHAARTIAPGERALEVDITNGASVRNAFERAKPEVVTHLAALSDIDRCERERELAERINFLGAMNVARECKQAEARLIYSSTDAVFDGSKGIYYEGDPPTPLNWYGQTKARAEQAIGELLPSAAIVRFSLVLGFSALPGGNSYLEKVAGNLKAGNAIVTPTFEYRNPIDVTTLCEFLLELAPNHAASGVFQIGASDKMSRFEIARRIAKRLGGDPELVVAQDTPAPGRAPRGRDDFLVADRLRRFCHTPVPTCEQVIERATHAVA